MNTGKESNSHHYMENVWFKTVSQPKKGQLQLVNICIRLEDNTFVTVGVLYLYEDIYYTEKSEPIGGIEDIALVNYVEKITRLTLSKAPAAASEPTYTTNTSVEEVCEEYRRTNSIKGTAKKVGISEEKTKKILIRAGLYTSEKHRKIKALIEQGKTLEEISRELQMSQKQLSVFVPSEKSNRKKR